MKQSLLFALTFLCIGFAHERADASSFDVTPIVLTLTPKLASSMVAVTNRSAEAVRFTISVMAWSESPNGEMLLTPTKDIVFFPSMLTLGPGEARNIRVGTSLPPGATEKTYRMFVQELPSLQKSKDEAAVHMLSKMGLPIFVQGTTVKPAPSVSKLLFAGQKAKFTIKNAGNAHFKVQKILLMAKDEKGKVIHSQDVPGWYVLAGGTHDFDVSLPIEVCGTMRSIEVNLKSDKGEVSTAKLGNAVCTR